MANADYIACIDAGTTGCRTILFAGDGRIVAKAYEGYESIFLSPTWIEHDPETWRGAARNTLKQATSEAGVCRLAAVCVISQRATFIPVDRAGRPIDRAILWQDKRAVKQADLIRAEVGDECIYQKTGLRIDPYFSLPKLLWIKENKPEILNAAYKLLSVHDFIVHDLTGRFLTEWTQASRTMLLNIRRFEWDADLCDCFGIPVELLPETVPPGSVAGSLRPAIVQELGLSGDVPVVAVGGDQQAAAVGMGLVQPGTVGANTGTGSFVLACTDKPVLDELRRVICTAAAIPGNWLIEGSIITSGCVYDWFRDRLAPAECADVEDLDREIERAGPGAGGLLLLPHFAGAAAPYWNPQATGVLFGMTLAHRRAHVLRAVFEGIALEIERNLRVMDELGGSSSEVRISGGLTRSCTFDHIQADVYARTILRVVCEEASALGAMAGACAAIGRYASIRAAAEALVHVGSRNYPDPATRPVYERLIALHDAVYEALASHGLYQTQDQLKTLISDSWRQ
jgi:glycerol kinase